jgi:uncharacterized membrane protein (UPF0127 family)
LAHLTLYNRTQDRVAVARLARARTLRERAVGLLGRPPLAADEGLWLEPCGGVHTWGMRYPIDVIFLDRELRVLAVRRQVPPWRLVFAPRGTRSVVELPAGGAADLNAGDALGTSNG